MPHPIQFEYLDGDRVRYILSLEEGVCESSFPRRLTAGDFEFIQTQLARIISERRPPAQKGGAK